ncbi:MAG: hypothetical protein JOZ57_07745, partial [Abitibacteriaceae bacterium]|nr:hypothetical protein [Abditibacteriaceae bacterium]
EAVKAQYQKELEQFRGQQQKEIEEFKHHYARELESARFDINKLFSRASKIHDKEFEVLPIAWTKFLDAWGQMMAFTSLIQEYPDLDKMPADQLEYFLEQSPNLSPPDKDEIRTASKKTECYIEKRYWSRLNETTEKVNEFNNYIMHNRIFLGTALFNEFKEIDKFLFHALIEIRTYKTVGDNRPLSKTFLSLREKEETVINKLEAMVQSRLHYDAA